MRNNVWLLLFAVVFIGACKKDSVDDDGGMMPPAPPLPETAVNVILAEMPFTTLSEYRFFLGDEMKAMSPNERVLAYEPISTLFSDYAHKSRFVWMPEGTSASFDEDRKILNFPNGAVLIKTFFYDNVQPSNDRRLIETRLLYKEAGAWKFADYIWNEDQTEATFSLSGSTEPIEFLNDDDEIQTVNYRIPSEAQCLTCHKMGEDAIPIGPKPQNLNSNFDYPDGSRDNQLMKWFEAGYLSQEPATESINTVVKWDDEALDLELRVRSYLDINCAHCHREGGHCDYRDIRLAYSESSTAEALGICTTPEEFLDGSQRYIVNPGNESKSALYFRLFSTAEEVRMPLLGRTVQHKEGLEMIESWINQLTQECD